MFLNSDGMNFITRKIDFLIPMLVGIFSVFVSYNYVGGGVINYIDHQYPFYIADHLNRLSFAWNDYIYMGYNHSVNLMNNIGYYAIFYVFEKMHFGYVVINRLEHGLAIFSIIYFTYLFLISLFKFPLSTREKIALLLVSSFALSNLVNRDLFTIGLPQQILAFSGMPAALFGIRKYLLTKNKLYFLLFLLSSLIISSFNLPYSIIALVAVILFSLLFSDFILSAKLKAIFIFLIIWGSINAYWLFPMAYSIFIEPPYKMDEAIQGKEGLVDVLMLSSERYSLDYLFQMGANLPLVMQQNNEHTDLMKYFSSRWLLILSYAFVVMILFLSLRQKFIRQYIDRVGLDPQKLLVLFLVFIFLAKGVAMPFGDLYFYFYESSNFFKVFRDSLKWIIIPVYMLIILASYILIFSKNRIIKSLIVIFFAAHLLPWGFDLFGRLKAYEVPGYYFSLHDFYENQYGNSNKRAFILDSTEGPTQFEFDIENKNKKSLSGNILKFISPIPVTDLFSNGSGISFNLLEKTLDTLMGDDRDLSVFQKLGITHIYRQLDIKNPADYRYTEKYFDKKTFGKIEVYEMRKDYVLPKIFLSQNKDQSLVSFRKMNPSKYAIKIDHIRTSVGLNFLYTIDKNWNLYIDKNKKDYGCDFYENYTMDSIECFNTKTESFFGSLRDILYIFQKPVFNETQKVVYGYANGWIIDPEYIKKNFSKDQYHENADGSINIDLTLYFKPQSYFYLGLIMSGATLVGCLGYLGYVAIIKRRKTE